jgi:hypothetical protein
MHERVGCAAPPQRPGRWAIVEPRADTAGIDDVAGDRWINVNNRDRHAPGSTGRRSSLRRLPAPEVGANASVARHPLDDQRPLWPVALACARGARRKRGPLPRRCGRRVVRGGPE